MALNVNAQAWGDVAEWISSTTTGNYFTYPWQRRNWNNIYSAGHQSINQDIDLSIAPWRINKKSVLVDLMGNYWYNSAYNSEGTLINADDQGQAHPSIFEAVERKNVPFILSYIGSSGTSFPQLYTKYWAYKFDNAAVLKEDNNVGNRFPVANFRYDKIRICPVTWWISADPENMSTNRPTPSQFGGLPNAESLAATPYCVGIGFRIFIDKNGTWTEVPMTIDINTHFYGEGSIENWYATEDGMFMMRMPWMSNTAGTHYNNMFFGQSVTLDMSASEVERGDERAKTFSFTRASYDSTDTFGRGGIIAGDFEGFRYNQKLIKKTGISIFSGFQYKMFSSTDELRELIMRELAYIGLPFVMSSNLVSTASLDNNNLYLPVFDANRCTTGKWQTGAEARELPNASWTWIYSINPLPEDKDDGEDEDEDGDTGDRNNATLHDLRYRGANHYYIVGRQGLSDFTSTINGLYVGEDDPEKKRAIDFMGSNPSDYIVGVYGMPIFMLAATVGETIKVGAVDTGIQAAILSPDWLVQRSFGSINFANIDIFTGDFRDYAPYTSIQVYIPLCGTVEIDPADYVGHTMTLDYLIDLQTGDLTARIIRDDLTVTHTASGSAWVQIPVNALKMGDFQNNQHQLRMALFNTGLSALKGTASRAGTDISNAVNAASAGEGAKFNGSMLSGLNAFTVAGDAASTLLATADLKYQLTHNPPSVDVTSTASAANGVLMYQYAKVFIKRAKMLPYDKQIYAHTVGHACLKNTTVGNEVSANKNSLIVCSNVDTSGIAATAQEISAIHDALTRGIYV